MFTKEKHALLVQLLEQAATYVEELGNKKLCNKLLDTADWVEDNVPVPETKNVT